MKQCQKVLEDGTQCSNRAVPGTDFCRGHRKSGKRKFVFRRVTDSAIEAEPPGGDEPGEWRARPATAGAALAPKAFRWDDRGIVVGPEGWFRIEKDLSDRKTDTPINRLIRLLSHLSHEIDLADGLAVLAVDGGYLIRVRPSDPEMPELSRFYDTVAGGGDFSTAPFYVGDGRVCVPYRDEDGPIGYTISGKGSPPESGIALVGQEGASVFSSRSLREQSLDELIMSIRPVPYRTPAVPGHVFCLADPRMYAMLSRYFRVHGMAFRAARLLTDDGVDRVLFDLAPDGGRDDPTPDFVIAYLERLPRCVVLSVVDGPADAPRMLVQRNRYFPISRILGLFDGGGLLIFTADPVVGNLWVRSGPSFVDGDALASVSGPAIVPVRDVAEGSGDPSPVSVAVRLVPDPRPAGTQPDARLLDRRQSQWLARVIHRLPDRAFARYRLFWGEDCAVILGDADPVTDIPFGTPLRRAKAEGLFIPREMKLVPNISWRLLAEALEIPDGTLTILTDRGRVDIPERECLPLSRTLVAGSAYPAVRLRSRREDRPAAPDWTPPPRRDGKAGGFFDKLKTAAGSRKPDDKPPPPPDETEAFRRRAESLREAGDPLGAAVCYSLIPDGTGAARCYRDVAWTLKPTKGDAR